MQSKLSFFFFGWGREDGGKRYIQQAGAFWIEHTGIVLLCSQLGGRQGKVSDEVKMAGRCQRLQFFSLSILDNYLLMILHQAC